jgi:hypothetical protein
VYGLVDDGLVDDGLVDDGLVDEDEPREQPEAASTEIDNTATQDFRIRILALLSTLEEIPNRAGLGSTMTIIP